MKTCELRLMKSDGQIVVGTIVLDGNEVFGMSEAGYENLVKRVLAQPILTGTTTYDSQKEPTLWFENLPNQYRGSYFSAVMSEEKS